MMCTTTADGVFCFHVSSPKRMSSQVCSPIAVACTVRKSKSLCCRSNGLFLACISGVSGFPERCCLPTHLHPLHTDELQVVIMVSTMCQQLLQACYELDGLVLVRPAARPGSAPSYQLRGQPMPATCLAVPCSRVLDSVCMQH